MAKPWESDPVATPWDADELDGPQTPSAPPPKVGAVEGVLTGMEAGVDYLTGGAGSAINRAGGSPLQALRKLGQRVTENVTIDKRNWAPTPEQRAAAQAERERARAEAAQAAEAQTDSDVARQYRAYKDRPNSFAAGAMAGVAPLVAPAATSALLSRGAQGLGQTLGPSAARLEALAQKGVGRVYRNPSKVGELGPYSGPEHRARVLQAPLDYKGVKLRSPAAPQMINDAAQAENAVLGPKLSSMTAAADARGATVDAGQAIVKFRDSLPSTFLKDPNKQPFIKATEEYIVAASKERGGRMLSTTNAHEIRQQLDDAIYGIVGEKDPTGKLAPTLSGYVRKAWDAELGSVMQRNGFTDWATTNQKFSVNKDVSRIAKGGWKNVESEMAQPTKPLIKLRFIGGNVQPVAYVTGAGKHQRLNAMKTRTRDVLAKRIRALQQAPATPPSTAGLGPQPYTPGPGVPPGRAMAPAPQPPMRGGVGPGPGVGPIPAGPSPYAYPGPASAGLPPARSIQLGPSSLPPRKLLPATAAPEGQGGPFTLFRPAEQAAPLGRPPATRMSKAERAATRAKALRIRKTTPQTLTPEQRRTEALWEARVKNKLERRATKPEKE